MIKYLLIVPLFFIPQVASATVFYISFDTSSTTRCAATNDGLATTSAFCSLDQFTEVARASGDIAVVQRGTATTTGITDLNFTSDGDVSLPIIITADYNDMWRGTASSTATSTQTYTMVVGSTTMTASASQSDIQAGEWVYVEGDCYENVTATTLNTCEFAYEVQAVNTTSIQLYLQYKGLNAGAGKALRIMPPNPQWNVASGDFQWNFDLDHHWIVKGMDIRGTDQNGQVEIDSSFGHIFIDTIFTGSTIDSGTVFTDDFYNTIFRKSRQSNHDTIFQVGVDDTYGSLSIYENYIVPRSASGGTPCLSGPSSLGFNFIKYISSICVNTANSAAAIQINGAVRALIRDSAFFSQTHVRPGGPIPILSTISLENNLGLISDITGTSSVNYGGISDTGNYVTNKFAPTISISVSATFLRAGGGPVSSQIIPTATTSAIWDFTLIKLFEYGINTDTTSRTYDIYFMSTSTSAWTANPTASELWIQCEEYDYPTTANATTTRRIVKSTGTVNFTGSTAYQAISVTCQPTHSGKLYLSGFYGKTKESGKMNEFYFDNQLQITP